ncbi:hypothetical protein TRVL_05294 [Trypanosoma vivax]|nr:hypothetical protein TRVL_05294 [Trypanosoma vivax]
MRRSVPSLITGRTWIKDYRLAGSAATLSQAELLQLAQGLESDPELLVNMLRSLDPQSRRRLIVAGGAMEWFGKESVVSEVQRADADKDRFISPKDFDHWLGSALRRRQKEKCLTEVNDDGTDVPCRTLVWVAFVAGLPFVGFGFLDNALMILAGDMINSTVGMYLNCSVQACAAMGNTFSGVLGMQFHGVIDKAVQNINVKVPSLTERQMKSGRVFFAGHIGGTIGITMGLLLGMLPLLVIDAKG